MFGIGEKRMRLSNFIAATVGISSQIHIPRRLPPFREPVTHKNDLWTDTHYTIAPRKFSIRDKFFVNHDHKYSPAIIRPLLFFIACFVCSCYFQFVTGKGKKSLCFVWKNNQRGFAPKTSSISAENFFGAYLRITPLS